MTIEDKRLLVIAAIVGLPWIVCLIHLWTRRGASFWKRAAWSLILATPIIGPLMYGALFRGLAPHGPSTSPVAGQGGVSYPKHPPHDHP